MKKITLLILSCNFLLSAFQSLTAQTTITLKPPLGDAVIGSGQATINFGSDPNLNVFTWTCSSALCHMQSCLNFDLSSIPSTATIDSADLYLYADVPDAAIAGQPMYGTDNAAWIRRVTQSWNENTVTWNNQPAVTTQNEATIPQSVTTAQDYVIDVTALLQDMINNPSTSFGFMLSEKNQTTWYNGLVFVSNNNPDTARAPKLVITYTDASSVNDIYSNGSALKVYPNPAADEIRIENSRSKMRAVDIYNMLGAKVMHQNLNSVNHVALNVQAVPDGVYFVSLQDEKNNLVSRKLIITR